jgi:hypothetical protein
MRRTIQTVCRTATIDIDPGESALSDEELAVRHDVPLYQPRRDSWVRLGVLCVLAILAALIRR